MFRLKTAKPYKPEMIPDENNILEWLNYLADTMEECKNDIADAVKRLQNYEISENDIRVACGIDSEQEG